MGVSELSRHSDYRQQDGRTDGRRRSQSAKPNSARSPTHSPARAAHKDRVRRSAEKSYDTLLSGVFYSAYVSACMLGADHGCKLRMIFVVVGILTT